MAWDAPEHYGVACKRVDVRDPATSSVFNRRREAPAALARSVPAELVVISGSDEGWVTLEDLALVPIIFILGALAPYGAGAGWDALLKTAVLGFALIALMMIGGRYLLPPLFAQAARAKNPELFLSASLLVVILASGSRTWPNPTPC